LPPADERRIHGLMARTLIARGVDDPEALHAHYRGAGDHSNAALQAAIAGTKADAALAFDRAANYYRAALELQPDSPSRVVWKEHLAAALANAGRPTQAAGSYLDAAAEAHPPHRSELQRCAAEQLLVGGKIDRGLEVIRIVLRDLGLSLATSEHRALASFLLRRARLRWRGFEFVARDAAAISAADLFRIDTCWSLSTGLALVDNILAADFHTRYLLLALDAGEPRRIACGLAMEAAFSAIEGGPAMQRTAALIARARTVAESIGDPRTVGLCTLIEGMAAYMAGRWRQASVICERALEVLQGQCVGVTWELNFAHNVLLASLVHQGEFREVSRRYQIVLATAREHGNLYIETELQTIMIATWLVSDDPVEGERRASELMAQWEHQGFHRQHHNYVLMRVRTALYCGRVEDAWQLITQNWAAMKRSHGLRTQWMRIEATFVRARCALLMAATQRNPARFLSLARRDGCRIARERMPWSDPMALLVEAGVANLAGDPARAAERLSGSIDGFERADMKMYAAVARRRLGPLLGGERGRQLTRESDEWASAQQLKNPDRMARLVAPGFPDTECAG
jgi:hypothetical protein